MMSSLYRELPFSGSYTALITPFKEDGSLDEARFEALVEWQIEQGTDGLVPVGTTGTAAVWVEPSIEHGHSAGLNARHSAGGVRSARLRCQGARGS